MHANVATGQNSVAPRAPEFLPTHDAISLLHSDPTMCNTTQLTYGPDLSAPTNPEPLVASSATSCLDMLYNKLLDRQVRPELTAVQTGIPQWFHRPPILLNDGLGARWPRHHITGVTLAASRAHTANSLSVITKSCSASYWFMMMYTHEHSRPSCSGNVRRGRGRVELWWKVNKLSTPPTHRQARV